MKRYYLLYIQFLGFRYHGWQFQPDFITVQGKLTQVLGKFFDLETMSNIGGSRTDAMVSANEYVVKLKLIDTKIEDQFSDFNHFIKELNKILPPDIKALKIEESYKDFNIIQSPKLKEYHYFFSSGNFKPHPFSAPLITHMIEELDIELMKKGAKIFEGTHDFRKYCYMPHQDKDFVKTIQSCEILENDLYQANFFPEKTYYMKVVGHSFMRHQIRLMIGTLFKLGSGEISLQDIEKSFEEKDTKFIGFIAPASGLVLHKIIYEN